MKYGPNNNLTDQDSKEFKAMLDDVPGIIGTFRIIKLNQ
jgi:hypothetical protein